MIKQLLREALLKEANKKRDYGCLMVFSKVKDNDWKNLQDMIEDDDLYTEEDDDSYGRELEPHTTILYGLHDTIEDKDIEVDIKKIKEPKIKFKGISSFNNDKFDVLKFDVESSDLTKLNKKFSEYPNTNKFPDYHAHATICYLKSGKADKYIKKLKDMVNIKMEPDKIVYSKADGSKKNYEL